MDFILDLPVQVYKVPAGEHFSVGDLCDGKIFGTEFQKREKKQDFSVIFKSGLVILMNQPTGGDQPTCDFRNG